jgi:carboxylesterase type B
MHYKYSGGIEDCLYLNVYTNAKPSNTGPYPVLFYLHGGGLMGGSTADDQFGGFIAHGKLVVILLALLLCNSIFFVKDF